MVCTKRKNFMNNAESCDSTLNPDRGASDRTSFKYDEICIALDLETTGLDPQEDEIIEIGAIKFLGEEIIESFHSIVNPSRNLSEFIKDLTGIKQQEVDRAPSFDSISTDFIDFLGSYPIVGQNIYFDLNFLEKKGIYKLHSYDTREMAAILLPSLREYSLAFLSSSFGLNNEQPHRALSDTQVTLDTFNKLIDVASNMEEEVLAELAVLQTKAGNSLATLFSRVKTIKYGDNVIEQIAMKSKVARDTKHTNTYDISSIDTGRSDLELSVERVKQIFSESSKLATSIHGYRYRSEQVEMAESVTTALKNKKVLIVEAGTGVGKSMAYLIPTMLLAMKENKRIVVSTNTINLQEQLINKDIPIILEALASIEPAFENFRFSILKGRDNYLCKRLWHEMRVAPSLNREDAKLACKMLVWLENSTTGDRSEINLERHDFSSWSKLSGATSANCPYMDGVACFLRDARENAEMSHLIVVNHALLLRDLADRNGIIPEYDYVVIDEAHHLEDEATRQFGTSIARSDTDEYLGYFQGSNGLLERIRSALSRFDKKEAVNAIDVLIEEIVLVHKRINDNIEILWTTLSIFLRKYNDGTDNRQLVVRLNHENMSSKEWVDVENAYGNVDLGFSGLENTLDKIYSRLDLHDISKQLDSKDIEMSVSNTLKATKDLKSSFKEFMAKGQEDKILWVMQDGSQGTVVLNSAPLDVGTMLGDALFSEKECVIMTSATLAIQGKFDYIKGRLGIEYAEELLLGSPFDYPKALLLAIPRDMPQINDWDHQQALVEAIIDVCQAADGRTMVLFTSHASLRLARNGVKGILESSGYQVLGQGVDGTPRQLLLSFQRNKKSLLLGTASFWEGVDFPNGSLKALIIPRLPFNVPTDPIFSARSQLFENSFNAYALPLAAIRFRQGFGRLIRSEEDKGVVIVLDSRIISRSYGKVFLESIPESTRSTMNLRELPSEVSKWLNINT